MPCVGLALLSIAALAGSAAHATTLTLAAGTLGEIHLLVRQFSSSASGTILDVTLPVELVGSMTVERSETGFQVTDMRVSVAGLPETFALTGVFREPVSFVLSAATWHVNESVDFFLPFGDRGSALAGSSGFTRWDGIASAYTLQHQGFSRSGGSSCCGVLSQALTVGPSASISVAPDTVSISSFAVGYGDRIEDLHPDNGHFRVFEPTISAGLLMFVPEPTNATLVAMGTLILGTMRRLRIGRVRERRQAR